MMVSYSRSRRCHTHQYAIWPHLSPPKGTVHPHNQHLLGMFWQGAVYIDKKIAIWATISSKYLLYFSAKRRYYQFCYANHFNPLPTSEHRLCQFITSLAMEGLSHTTLKRYLSGIRHLHLENHFENQHKHHGTVITSPEGHKGS